MANSRLSLTYNNSKKIIAAGALFFNKKGELLIIKPTYKNHWSIPGGMAKQNESPVQTCRRETKEETGLKLKSPKILCIEYIFRPKKTLESLQFVFYGGILSQHEISKIKLPPKEISEYRFVRPKVAPSMVSENMAKRLIVSLRAIKTKKIVYLENGEVHHKLDRKTEFLFNFATQN